MLVPCRVLPILGTVTKPWRVEYEALRELRLERCPMG